MSVTQITTDSDDASTAPTPLLGNSAGDVRWAWADNLRVAIIAGVIVTHVATTYILDIDWYYEARTASPLAEAIVAALILPTALFAMGALFFVAGVVAQRSIARHGPRRFVIGRLWRLGVPLAVFSFVLGPLTSLIGGRAEHEPATRHAAQFLWTEMRRADVGPMWFIAALLVFDIAFATVAVRRPKHRPQPRRKIGRTLLAAGVVVVVGSFVVRLRWPFAEDTPLSLNLWEWPQMAVLFSLGVISANREWPAPLPTGVVHGCRRAGLIALAGLPLLGVAIAIGDKEAFLGGWHAEAFAEPTLEAAISIGMAFTLIDWFRRRWNQRGTIARTLGRASFGAYFVHATVVVALSVALATTPAPAEIKFLIVAALGVVTSYTVAVALVTLPGVRRLL